MLPGLLLATILMALVVWLAAMSIQRGLWPRGKDSTKWYDRAASAIFGIVLLALLVFAVFGLPNSL